MMRDLVALYLGCAGCVTLLQHPGAPQPKCNPQNEAQYEEVEEFGKDDEDSGTIDGRAWPKTLQVASVSILWLTS